MAADRTKCTEGWEQLQGQNIAENESKAKRISGGWAEIFGWTPTTKGGERRDERWNGQIRQARHEDGGRAEVSWRHCRIAAEEHMGMRRRLLDQKTFTHLARYCSVKVSRHILDNQNTYTILRNKSDLKLTRYKGAPDNIDICIRYLKKRNFLFLYNSQIAKRWARNPKVFCIRLSLENKCGAQAAVRGSYSTIWWVPSKPPKRLEFLSEAKIIDLGMAKDCRQCATRLRHCPLTSRKKQSRPAHFRKNNHLLGLAQWNSIDHPDDLRVRIAGDDRLEANFVAFVTFDVLNCSLEENSSSTDQKWWLSIFEGAQRHWV